MAVAITQRAHPASVATTANVTSYAGVAIGTAAPGRVVAVAISKEVATTTVSGVTIDGVSMTLQDQATFGSVGAYIYTLPWTTGTTATIAVTWTGSANILETQITVYEVTGASYFSASHGNNTSTDMDASSPLSLAIVVPSGGAALAVAAGATDTAGKTWANITEDRDDDVGPYRHTTATRTTAGSVTITCTGGTNNEDGALAAVIFKPGAAVTAGAGSSALFTFAGGATTTPKWGHKVAATTDSFVFSGLSTTLKFSIGAGAGSYAYTGDDYLRDLGINPGSGAFAFTGSNVGFTISGVGTTLAVDSGSFVYTGIDAFSDYGIPVSGGSFAFTGTAATLTPGDSTLELPLDAGSFVFTGSDATPKWGHKVAAGAASFAFTGSDAGLSRANLVAGPGTFAYTGEDALVDLGLNAGTTSFSYTGSNATLDVTHTGAELNPDAGSFSFTGEDAFSDLGINPAAGSFAFSGSDAGLLTSARILTAVGDEFTFTGATTLRDRILVLVGGSFTFSGSTAGLRWVHTLPATGTSFSFTGSAVALQYAPTSKAILLEATSFSFTGQNALVDLGIVSDSGSFVFTGSEAALTRTGLSMEAVAGSFLISGQDAILSRSPYQVHAESGSYVFGGPNVTFRFGGAHHRGLAIPGGGSKRYVDLSKQKAGFSRKYYDEMRAAERAALDALKAASVRKRVEQQEALEEAARAAQEAIEAVQEREAEVDLTRLTRALNAAVSAKNFATSLKRAQDAIAAANAIMEEEEEEAIVLLLMHH